MRPFFPVFPEPPGTHRPGQGRVGKSRLLSSYSVNTIFVSNGIIICIYIIGRVSIEGASGDVKARFIYSLFINC